MDPPRPLGTEADDLRVELAKAKQLLSEERRFIRLVSESARTMAPESTVHLLAHIETLERHTETLERTLRLITMSRAYKAGHVVHKAKEVVNRIRPRSRAPAEPQSSARTPFTEVSLPPGVGRPVLFFVPWLIHGGGAEGFVSQLAVSLVEDGRTVVVVVTHGLVPGTSDATEPMRRITPHVFDLTKLDRSTWLPYCEAVLRQFDQPVIVNVGSTWLYQNLKALRVAGGHDVKVIDQLFNHVGHVASNLASGSDIDATVVVHRRLERLLVEHYRVRTPAITVMRGIPISPHRFTRRLRDRTVVGWLGRLSSEKRPLWFVELARVLGHRADFRLGGEGPQMQAVKSAATSIPSLHLSGLVHENLHFIAECDLLVLTSEVEGISCAAMEAISLGTPVVSTDVGGMAELIEPGINGCLVSPDDLDDLVACVKRLLDSPAELRQLQEHSRASGLSVRFTSEAMVERYREILA